MSHISVFVLNIKNLSPRVKEFMSRDKSTPLLDDPLVVKINVPDGMEMVGRISEWKYRNLVDYATELDARSPIGDPTLRSG